MNESLKNRLKTRLAAALATPTPPHEVSKSKWGDHPCCWATYQKLRLLNYLVLISKMSNAAWERWGRKFPENRVVRKRNGQRLPKPEPIPEPETFNFGATFLETVQIEDDYRLAKHPHGGQDEFGNHGMMLTEKLTLAPARIDALLKKAMEVLS